MSPPQEYAIECPSTGSLFSLKDGSVVAWYPNNPVLRALTPSNTCRRMEIYPIKLTQEAIYVDTSAARMGARTRAGRGGAGGGVGGQGLRGVGGVGVGGLRASACSYCV